MCVYETTKRLIISAAVNNSWPIPLNQQPDSTLSFQPLIPIFHSRVIYPTPTPHPRIMLIPRKQPHHLMNPHLHESNTSDKLDHLLPTIPKLAAEREDYACEVLDVGGLGVWVVRSGKGGGIHGRGLEDMTGVGLDWFCAEGDGGAEAAALGAALLGLYR